MFIQAHLNLKFSYIMVTLYKPMEMKFICKNSVIVPVDMKMWIKASQRFKIPVSLTISPVPVKQIDNG